MSFFQNTLNLINKASKLVKLDSEVKELFKPSETNYRGKSSGQNGQWRTKDF